MDDSWTTTLSLDAVEIFTITTGMDAIRTVYRPVLYLGCQQGYLMQVCVYSGGTKFARIGDLTWGEWDEGESLKASLRYRVGDKPAESADLHLAKNKATAWFENNVEIIRDLRGASRMLVEVDVVPGFSGRQQVLMTFDTRGLEHHLPLLTKHCPGQL